MENLRNRYLILIVVMAVTSVFSTVLSYETYPEAEAGIRAIKNIPKNMGDWKGRDFEVEERVYKILQTQSIVHRSYVKGNIEVFLSIVYYPETKTGFHTPDFCLAARGIQTSKSFHDITIRSGGLSRSITLNQLVYEFDNQTELAYYFFKAGDFLGQSYIKLRLNLAKNKIMNNNKSASLVRVSTIVPYGDMEGDSKILQQFIDALYPYLIEYL